MIKIPSPEEVRELQHAEFQKKFKAAYLKVYGPPSGEIIPDENNWKSSAEELQDWIDSGEPSFYEITEQTALINRKWQVADEEERKRLDEMGNILYRAYNKIFQEHELKGGFEATAAYKEAFGDNNQAEEQSYEGDQSKKRLKWKDVAHYEEVGWENIAAIQRWLDLGKPGSFELADQLRRVEDRILVNLTPELRELFNQRDFLAAEYRKRFFVEWVDDD